MSVTDSQQESGNSLSGWSPCLTCEPLVTYQGFSTSQQGQSLPFSHTKDHLRLKVLCNNILLRSVEITLEHLRIRMKADTSFCYCICTCRNMTRETAWWNCWATYTNKHVCECGVRMDVLLSKKCPNLPPSPSVWKALMFIHWLYGMCTQSQFNWFHYTASPMLSWLHVIVVQHK